MRVDFVVPLSVELVAFDVKLLHLGVRNFASFVVLIFVKPAVNLQACVGAPQTTTSLARVVGISNSSASEHAAVLRAAGLITSKRTANRVVHRATPIGTALMRRP